MKQLFVLITLVSLFFVGCMVPTSKKQPGPDSVTSEHFLNTTASQTISIGDTLYTYRYSDSTHTIQTTVDPESGVYVVKAGDCLWELSGKFLNDPLKWRQVYYDNPFLLKPGRMFWRDGKVIVLIYPGEELKGLRQIGFKSEKLIVINNYYFSKDWYIPGWIWLVVALAVLLAFLIGRITKNKTNASSSGSGSSSPEPSTSTPEKTVQPAGPVEEEPIKPVSRKGAKKYTIAGKEYSCPASEKMKVTTVTVTETITFE